MFAEMAWLDADPSNDRFTIVWVNDGTAYSNLIMEKGFDYRLRFFAVTNSTDIIDQTSAFSVAVSGLYGTIYPFEES